MRISRSLNLSVFTTRFSIVVIYPSKMFVKTVAVQLLIFGSIVAIANAGNHDHLFVVSQNKNKKCHIPLITGCNASLYPILDYKMAGWFFNVPFKSCRPLYTAGGVHNCTENKDLPLNKDECEDLCAEPCTMSNGSEGICMLEEYCKQVGDKSSAHPRPCGAYNVKCCPRRKSAAKSQIAINMVANNGMINDRQNRRVHHQLQ